MPVLRRELHGREELEAHRRHMAMRQQGMRLQGSRPRRRAARTSAGLHDARVEPPFRCFTFSLFHCAGFARIRGSALVYTTVEKPAPPWPWRRQRSIKPLAGAARQRSAPLTLGAGVTPADELFSLPPPDLVCYAYAMVNRQDVPYLPGLPGSPEIGRPPLSAEIIFDGTKLAIEGSRPKTTTNGINCSFRPYSISQKKTTIVARRIQARVQPAIPGEGKAGNHWWSGTCGQ